MITSGVRFRRAEVRAAHRRAPFRVRLWHVMLLLNFRKVLPHSPRTSADSNCDFDFRPDNPSDEGRLHRAVGASGVVPAFKRQGERDTP